MILIHLLIGGVILLVGVIVGKFLKYMVKKADRENKEMEAILKNYGKNKDIDNGNAGDGGGDLPHRL